MSKWASTAAGSHPEVTSSAAPNRTQVLAVNGLPLLASRPRRMAWCSNSGRMGRTPSAPARWPAARPLALPAQSPTQTTGASHRWRTVVKSSTWMFARSRPQERRSARVAGWTSAHAHHRQITAPTTSGVSEASSGSSARRSINSGSYATRVSQARRSCAAASGWPARRSRRARSQLASGSTGRRRSRSWRAGMSWPAWSRAEARASASARAPARGG